LVLFVTDITEQRRLRESLEATVHRTRVLDSTLRDIIWMTDEGFSFIFLSSSVQRVLGFSPEELVGAGMEKVLTERSMMTMRRAVTELLRGYSARRKSTITPYLLEVESLRKDGTRVWSEVSLSVHLEGVDGPVRIVGATRDISRRKGAERDLMMFSKAFHFSNEAMIITDERSRILDINPSAVRLLGASAREDLLGTVGLTLLVPEEMDRAVAAMRSSEPTPGEGLVYTVRNGSGSVRRVEVFSSPIPGEDGSTEGFIVLLKSQGGQP
jgi:PAS domain S-box-containing protein